MTKPNSPLTKYVLTNGNNRICYTLHEDIVPDEDGLLRSAFSLSIKMGKDQATMEDFTHKREKAVPILELFANEQVLPEELPFLAEDLLSDFDFVE